MVWWIKWARKEKGNEYKDRMRREKGERVGGGRHRAVGAQQVRVQEQACGEISRRRELEVFQWVVWDDEDKRAVEWQNEEDESGRKKHRQKGQMSYRRPWDEKNAQTSVSPLPTHTLWLRCALQHMLWSNMPLRTFHILLLSFNSAWCLPMAWRD